MVRYCVAIGSLLAAAIVLLHTSAVTAAGIDDDMTTTIHARKVVVFSKSYCPHSQAAKKLLEDLKADAHVVELDQEANGTEMQNYLKRTHDHHTVPAVFLHGELVGGNSELQQLHQEGNLEKLLEEERDDGIDEYEYDYEYGEEL